MTQDPRLRSHHFRHRRILNKRICEIKLKHWPFGNVELELLRKLIQCGPLEFSDVVDDQEKKILRSWRHYPRDRAFYKMLYQQARVWSECSELKLEDFLTSSAGRKWICSRRKLTRKPLFALDQLYKPTPGAAIRREESIKSLLRRQPLLRYKDLQSLNIKNAQKIIEAFTPLEIHRQEFLRKKVRGRIPPSPKASTNT